jgi:hypothetical protein
MVFGLPEPGLVAQHYGVKVAEAFFDTFSGWILFTVAFFSSSGCIAR